MASQQNQTELVAVAIPAFFLEYLVCFLILAQPKVDISQVIDSLY